jgi:hypothetical protein
MQNLAMELVESKETHVSIGREAEFYFVLASKETHVSIGRETEFSFVLASIQMHTIKKLYGNRKISFPQK